ncbi:MAG: ATP-binding protein [Candidatus Micrarchaeota archaeon]
MINDEIGFVNELLKVNEWWATGTSRKAEKYPKRRTVFSKLETELQSNRVLMLFGCRRVGKSVALHQLIQKLLDSRVPRENILYYQLDDPSLLSYASEPVKDLIEYALSKKNRGKTYVFLDEVQASQEWYKWIKAYQDRQLDLKFVLSGSSSLRIQTDANKYLRGRTTEVEMSPLGFREFLEMNEIEIPHVKKDAASLSVAKTKLSKPLEEYMLVGGFPEWLEVKKQEDSVQRWMSHLLSDVPKKAIYEDIAVFFGIRNPKVLDLLLNFIAVNQSKILSYEKMSQTVGIDRLTILNYLEFLKASYLIFEIPVYGSPKKQIKAMKKFLVTDQGLRNSLVKEYSLREDNQGFIVENLVGTTLYSNFESVTYWREQKHEVDFVAGDIPIEVKYKNVIGKGDLNGLLKFLEKNGKNKGAVITKDKFGRETIENKQITFIPFWLFLLEPNIISEGVKQ